MRNYALDLTLDSGQQREVTRTKPRRKGTQKRSVRGKFLSAQGTYAVKLYRWKIGRSLAYDAQVRAYNSLVDAEATRVKTDVLGYEAELKGYVATQRT